jgi:hypothetical protein
MVVSRFPLAEPVSNDTMLPVKNIVVQRALSNTYVDRAWRVAGKVLTKTDPPDLIPHFTFPGMSSWVYNDSAFWTSGFFPGLVWALYERSLKYGVGISSASLLKAAKSWQVELAKEQYTTDNHDLGFMIMPSFARDHELTGSPEALEIIINAARSLATRYDGRVQAIRSWAGARTHSYAFEDPANDFVVVIDSMMNLELLYYASLKSGDPQYAAIATALFYSLITVKLGAGTFFSPPTPNLSNLLIEASIYCCL